MKTANQPRSNKTAPETNKPKAQTKLTKHDFWLLNNPEALKKLERALNDAAEDRIKNLGSFAQYEYEEIDS